MSQAATAPAPLGRRIRRFMSDRPIVPLMVLLIALVGVLELLRPGIVNERWIANTIKFGAKEHQMTLEAAERLAAGTDPGIIPARFLIGSARFALDHKLARPGVITKNFYTELARR